VPRDLPAWVRRRLDPEARYGLRLTLFAVALTLVAIPFGILLDQVIRSGPLVEMDIAAAEAIQREIRNHPILIAILRIFSEIGRPPALFLTSTIAIVVLWRRSRRRLAVYIATTGLVGGLIDTAVKIAVDRDRPALDDPLATAMGQSFPSGHAMASTMVYGALLLVFLPAIPRRRRPLVFAGYVSLILAIGISRLGLGVHYLTDVVAGYALGFAWLAIATAAFSIWRQERGRAPVHVEEGIEPEAERDLHVRR
jgi:undecaprenyl-diphosphatase